MNKQTIWNFFCRHGWTILYGCSLALLLFLLKWLQLRFLIIDHHIEIYTGIIAIIFMVLGIWLAIRLSRPKVNTLVVHKEIYIPNGPTFTLNDTALKNLGLSSRELEVLQLMSQGLSNSEIAGQLYLSLNTVKTHASNVFTKLDVKRRTQAIQKAKELSLIP